LSFFGFVVAFTDNPCHPSSGKSVVLVRGLSSRVVSVVLGTLAPIFFKVLIEKNEMVQNSRNAILIAPALLCFFCMAFDSDLASAQKTDVKGKVVMANLDRYDAIVKIGNNRRTIKPKKASILTPKTYPITIEYWSGNTKNNWQRATISKAGVYGFNFKQGQWVLAAVNPKPKAPAAGTTPTSPPVQGAPGAATRPGVAQTTAVAPRPANNVLRQRVIQQPPMRHGINADRGRWSPLARVAWATGSI
jgi:hypothetical protein